MKRGIVGEKIIEKLGRRGGDDEVTSFAALVYDKNSGQFAVEELPLNTGEFWTDSNLGIKREAGDGVEQRHEVELSKIHEIDGDLEGIDSDLMAIWEKDSSEAEAWSKPNKEFTGKSIYIASHETTTVDSIKSAFQNIGLGSGTEWGSFIYIFIIVAVVVIGGYFLLTKLGIWGGF